MIIPLHMPIYTYIINTHTRLRTEGLATTLHHQTETPDTNLWDFTRHSSGSAPATLAIPTLSSWLCRLRLLHCLEYCRAIRYSKMQPFESCSAPGKRVSDSDVRDCGVHGLGADFHADPSRLDLDSKTPAALNLNPQDVTSKLQASIPKYSTLASLKVRNTKVLNPKL